LRGGIQKKLLYCFFEYSLWQMVKEHIGLFMLLDQFWFNSLRNYSWLFPSWTHTAIAAIRCFFSICQRKKSLPTNNRPQPNIENGDRMVDWWWTVPEQKKIESRQWPDRKELESRIFGEQQNHEISRAISKQEKDRIRNRADPSIYSYKINIMEKESGFHRGLFGILSFMRFILVLGT
jgi:hypothetical protein